MTQQERHTIPATLRLTLTAGETGLIHCTSPDVPELFVTGLTITEALEAVPPVLQAIQEAKAARP